MKKSKFQFQNPRISSFSINENENFDKDKFNGFSISTNLNIQILEDNDTAKVTLTIEIGDKTEQYPFFMHVKTYSLFRNYGADNFNDLLKINAPALLLSNVRPIIALMTSQLGFKPFYIPFMNFTDSNDEIQEDT
ncbi:MAG: protein-export chaperone SecB [Clostridium sp.]|nr:protein-export chaperone SecB [Clostridium sp.]MCM1460730.1 protein-export chaperone SecB [Bacteroides sp.]